jgi:hypothetical protein
MHAPPGSPENKMDWSLDRRDASSDAAAAGWQADGDGRQGRVVASASIRRRAHMAGAGSGALSGSSCFGVSSSSWSGFPCERACSVFLYALLLFLLLGE